MGKRDFDEAWKVDGLQAFAIRNLNTKRNQCAQTIKLKMFAPVKERKVNNYDLCNAGIGMKPYKSTHDEISEWVNEAKLLIPK